MSPPPLRRLGDYELLDELGSGGMGVVYRARHVQTQVEYALKLLRSTDVELVARFQREGESMARVDDHPHIARVRSLQREGRTSYLVMDVADGGSLEQRLRDGLPPVEQAVAWTRALAGALAYAHAKGILHRDLKPSNVLFMDDAPLLADFGLAKLVDAQSLTATGSVLGTPAYMSPEQVAGERDRVGPASDVYGLGALLFRCLTGQPPFQGSSNLDTMQRLLSDPPPSPRALRPDVSPALEAVCLQALAKDPSDRFPTAAAFGEALAETLAEAASPTRRTGGLVALGLLGAVALGAGLAARKVASPASPSPVSSVSRAAPTPADLHPPSPTEPSTDGPLPPLDPDYERRCPGPHAFDAACLVTANLHARFADARQLALQVLSSKPCRVHGAVLRELAVAAAFSPEPDLASIESYLLLATRLRDARACYNLGLLWLPRDRREKFYAGPMYRPDPARATAALWLANTWKPGVHELERTLDALPRRERPRDEDEALRLVESSGGIPRAPAPPEPPTEPHAMWSRSPDTDAAEAYDRFVAVRPGTQSDEPGARELAKKELTLVVQSPPGRFHRKGYLELAMLEHQIHGKSTKRCLLLLVRAALIGSSHAAGVLASGYNPHPLSLAPRLLKVDHDLELTLAFASLAQETIREVDGGSVRRLITALEQRNYVIPSPSEAYRAVWTAFPDAR